MSKTYVRGNLKIGALNIQGGLLNKSRLDEFSSIVNSFDILVVAETGKK